MSVTVSRRYNMKEFDFEKAKAGAPVCTRDGMPARIICWNYRHPLYKIIALADRGDFERILSFSLEGKYDKDIDNNDLDLMMAPVKHEGWVNIYKSSKDGWVVSAVVRATEKEARDAAKDLNISYVATVHIEWEE